MPSNKHSHRRDTPRSVCPSQESSLERVLDPVQSLISLTWLFIVQDREQWLGWYRAVAQHQRSWVRVSLRADCVRKCVGYVCRLVISCKKRKKKQQQQEEKEVSFSQLMVQIHQICLFISLASSDLSFLYLCRYV